MKTYLIILFIILGIPAIALLTGTLDLTWFRFLGFSYMVLGFVMAFFMDSLEGKFILKFAALMFISGLLMIATY